jgi:tryptophan-rich sensory protein
MCSSECLVLLSSSVFSSQRKKNYKKVFLLKIFPSFEPFLLPISSIFYILYSLIDCSALLQHAAERPTVAQHFGEKIAIFCEK